MNDLRIQDDLYNYVNKDKLEELIIPDDQPCIGGFQTLAIDVEKLMINEITTMCETEAYYNDYLKRTCELFKIAKDVHYNDNVIFKRGDRVQAKIGVIISPGMNGIPASIILKDFYLFIEKVHCQT